LHTFFSQHILQSPCEIIREIRFLLNGKRSESLLNFRNLICGFQYVYIDRFITMNFAKLAQYLNSLEKISSRIEITKVLANLFNTTQKSEIDKVTYLILGNLSPVYKGIVFNLAEKMLVRTLAKAYGENLVLVQRLYKEKGDLGEVGFVLAQNRKMKKNNHNLSVEDVYNKLYKIAVDEGAGSQERKVEKMAELLSDADPLSSRYLIRITLGKLRLGFSDKTILDALSWMETGGKSKKSLLESAYNLLPDVGLLAKNVKTYGIEGSVKRIAPTIGVPVLPMLAQRLKSPKDMIAKMKKVYVEPKFDGLRIQIHFNKGKFSDGTTVKAFTRNLNETSWMFPELNKIGKHVKAKELILDTEGIGVDEQRRTLANFQTTMTRRRKHDIEKIASKVSIKFYVFDVIYKDGKSLVGLPYKQRRKILSRSVVSGNLLQVVNYEATDSPKRIEEIMQKELKEGLEGIIVKRADSRYVAGRTGWRWVKMKEKESAKAKLSDTVDCVVMGYSAGKGKRTLFGLGQFLVGVRDKEDIKTVTKVGTGLTDKQFKELAVRLKKLEVKDKPKNYVVDKLLVPDSWVEPSLVVEIAADEITESPSHSSGYALRFPRLVKFRDDKSAEEATTLSEVKKLLKIQKS